jgi:hypothetical protein
MKPRHVLACASLLVVLWLIYLELDHTSPGPISRTHAQEAALLEPAGCALCHGEGGHGMARACGDCHTEIAGGLAAGTGFHGTLVGADATDCALCHLEHHGETFPLTDARSFTRAGYESRDAFDHASLEFLLEGRHAELACVDCHANADVLFLVQGQHRFLGLTQRCDTCHEDVHEGRIVRDCADCHGQEHPFEVVATFEHGRFPASGAHAEPACAECHVPDGERSVERLAGPGPFPRERGCDACHESPHGEGFLGAVTAALAGNHAASCGACHDDVHRDFAGHPEAMPRELHAASGFTLETPHDRAGCADCHAETAPFAARFPGRSADACAACHDDPHGGQFGDLGTWNGGCLDCHDRHAFLPSTFGTADHAGTSFPLEDSHQAVGCRACHVEPHEGDPRVFRGTATACAACHADAHRGLLATEEGCESCHQPTLFSDRREPFDHDRWTRFALEGAHADADCLACHRESVAADELGRRFGFAHEVFDGPIENCASCHADPHPGAFPEAAFGCETCHVPASFRAASADFDHGRWTGYELEGAHAASACEACHARSAHPDAQGRTFGRVEELFGTPAQDCATCHTDAHRGALVGEGADDCATCHLPTAFTELAAPFDHGRWTGYVTAGQHAAVACDACHVPSEQPDATGRRFGWARGRACADCHADPHAGQFLEAGRTDCARCHSDAEGLVFDHAIHSRFPLDETHLPLDCSVCHLPWPLASGEQVIRYKPLGTTCVECHGPDFRRER